MNHLKSKILFGGLFIFSLSTTAQTVLLSVDKDGEKIIQRGPNLKNHVQVYFHFGFVAGSDKPGARIIYGSSTDLAFGIRKRHKISPLYSIGFEAEFERLSYKLKQTNEKFFPDTILNYSQSLRNFSLGLGVFNRFNFDPHRGNFLGTYLDLGIMGGWDFGYYEYTRNKLPNGTKEAKSISNLSYVNNLDAKVCARMGFSHGSIYTSYRLTKLFKTSYNYPDLPRLVVGVELSVL